jgi:hypothetical protein
MKVRFEYSTYPTQRDSHPTGGNVRGFGIGERQHIGR